MKNAHQSHGFTFIETLVAISVLLISITAPLTLASQGLVASRIARDTMVSTYLAQEAIEYVRNVRDSNALTGAYWLAGLDVCVDTKGCALDIGTNDLVSCVNGEESECDPLMFNENNGLYGLGSGDGWVPTKFTRRIIVETESATEANVIVYMTWEDGIKSRAVETQERIFDWP